MNLTPTERLLLANQYAILASLNPDHASHYENLAEILLMGYEGLYDVHLFSTVENVVSREQCNVVFEILNMFRDFPKEISGLNDTEKKKLTFQGFDGHQGPYLYFAKFLIERIGSYPEHKSLKLDNHGERKIESYMKMLDKYKEIKQAKQLWENLTTIDLQQIAAVG